MALKMELIRRDGGALWSYSLESGVTASVKPSKARPGAKDFRDGDIWHWEILAATPTGPCRLVAPFTGGSDLVSLQKFKTPEHAYAFFRMVSAAGGAIECALREEM